MHNDDILTKEKKRHLRKLAFAELDRLMKPVPGINALPLHKQKSRVSISELTKPEQILFAQESELPLAKGLIPMMGEKPAVKEPWEMTQAEAWARESKIGKGKHTADRPGVKWQRWHETKVKNALNEGKPVPTEVLKDYPNLRTNKQPIEKKLPRIRSKPFQAGFEGERRRPTNIFQWIIKEGGMEPSIEFADILDAYKKSPSFVRKDGKSLDELTDAMQEQFAYLYGDLDEKDHQGRLTRTVTVLAEAVKDKTYAQKLMDEGALNKWLARTCEQYLEEEDARLYEGIDDFCIRNGLPTPKEVEEAYWEEKEREQAKAQTAIDG